MRRYFYFSGKNKIHHGGTFRLRSGRVSNTEKSWAKGKSKATADYEDANSSQVKSQLANSYPSNARLLLSNYSCDSGNAPECRRGCPTQNDRAQGDGYSFYEAGERGREQCVLQPAHEGIVNQVHAVSVAGQAIEHAMRRVAKRANSDMNPKHEEAQESTHRIPSSGPQGSDLPTPLIMVIKAAASAR